MSALAMIQMVEATATAPTAVVSPSRSTATSVPSAVTTTVLPGPLPGQCRLLVPLVVTVEPDEDGGFVACEESIGNVYGVGSTRAAALGDLAESLVEYHDLAEALSKSGDPGAARLWGRVSARIARR